MNGTKSPSDVYQGEDMYENPTFNPYAEESYYEKMPEADTEVEGQRYRQTGFLGAKEPVGYCPSCGRHIGDREACPYCAAKTTGRVSEKWIIMSTVPMVAIGIVLLLLASAITTPITHIDEIGSDDSMRSIRVHGWVVSTSYRSAAYKDFGTLKIYVAEEDTNGDEVIDTYDDKLLVRIQYYVTPKLKEKGIIPAVGDEVYVEGVVYVFETFNMMDIRNADMIEIVEPTYTEISIDTLLNSTQNDFAAGKKVTIKGKIAERPTLSTWLSKLYIASETGRKIEVPIWSSTILMSDDAITSDNEEKWPDYSEWYLAKFSSLDTVEVKGALSWYNGVWQVEPRSVKDITLISPAPTTYTEVNLTEVIKNPTTYTYQKLAFKGVTVNWAYYGNSDSFALFEIFLDDPKINISLVAFSSPNLKGVIEGRKLDLYGIIVQYGDEWEILIDGETGDYAVVQQITYSNITITELWTNPDQYLMKPVRFENVKCTWTWDSNERDYGLFRFAEEDTDNEIFVVADAFETTQYDITAVNRNSWYTITGTFVKYEFSEQYGWTYEVDMNGVGGDIIVEVEPQYEPSTYTTLTLNQLLTNPSSYNSQFVEVLGAEVTEIAWFSSSAKFYITDTTTTQSLMIYAESGSNLPSFIKVGEDVDVRGQVTQYQGEWQISVRAGSSDEIVSYVALVYTPVDIKTLLASPETYNNTHVFLENVYVTTMITDSSYKIFTVMDSSSTEELKVYLASGATSPTTIAEDNQLTIKGFFKSYKGEWEIEVRSGTEDAITKVTQTRSDSDPGPLPGTSDYESIQEVTA